MKADYHIHSSYSGDSDTPMKEMVKRGIALGLKTMCFTEHVDLEYPYDTPDFSLDTESYYRKFVTEKEYFKDQIELLFGVELGLKSGLSEKLISYVNRYPFDFIIGSTHLVDNLDPYHPECFLERSEEEFYQAYFETAYQNLLDFSEFSVYGHLDYIVRYGPNKNKNYSYQKYAEIIDELLRILIKKNIGMEVNTAGFKYGLNQPHPHPDILKRYKEMGGQLITVGSDAHCTEHLAYEFDQVHQLLKSCGYTYYTEFRNRKPDFIKL